MISHFRVDLDEAVQAGVLRLHGELDVAAIPIFEAELEQVSMRELVIVDLTDLEFIDSSGIGALVRADQRAAEAGRRFALIRGSGQVSQLLELTGLAERLMVVETLAQLTGG